MKFKPTFTGNMKAIRLSDAVRFAASVPGGEYLCNGDDLSAIRTAPANADRRSVWPQAWLTALHAPANRSKLVAFEFLVLHAVGRNEWNRAITAPVNLDVYADERAYQAEAWRNAMAKMQDFYQQASKRKGIVL